MCPLGVTRLNWGGMALAGVYKKKVIELAITLEIYCFAVLQFLVPIHIYLT